MDGFKEKKRYWLKLDKNFLKSTHIKVIKNMPNGKDYILFYLSLMLESVETIGHLRFSDLVPYNEEMLSSITDTNVDIVRSAVEIFKQLGLLEMFDDGTIFMTQVAMMTGKESESAERVRQYRLKIKNQNLLQCNTDVTKCNDNKEEDKQIIETKNNEEEKETEKDLFNKFWDVYPKKKSKGNAEKWFLKNKPSEDLVNEMISKIKLLKKTDDWKNDNGKYIPYPVTWLNAKGWEDEVEIKINTKKNLPVFKD